MNFKRWKDLSDEEKNIRLKKICGGAAVVFVIVILLLLMKCEGCSSEGRRKHGRNFYDGKGHSYGEELSGAGIFDNEYGKGVEEYTLSDSDSDSDEARRRKEAELAALKASEEQAAREAEEAAEEVAEEASDDAKSE